MTRADIEKVLDQIPNLTTSGIGVYRCKPEERAALMREGRQELLRSTAVCTKVCEWLTKQAKTKRFHPWRTSYGLKHVVERQIAEYVSNGAFIAAAVHMGFRYEFVTRPNVRINISERSIKKSLPKRSPPSFADIGEVAV